MPTNVLRADAGKIELLDKFGVGPKILDVGCGKGIYSEYLADRGYQVTAVDLDPEIIKQNRLRNPNVKYDQADIARLPYKNKSMTTAVLFDVLEHVDDVKGLKEVIRVTRKRIIVCVPATTHPQLAELFLLYGHHADTTHRRTYTQESLKDLLERAGLRVRWLQPGNFLASEALLLNMMQGNEWGLRLWRKISLSMFKPRPFNTNWLAVADVV